MLWECFEPAFVPPASTLQVCLTMVDLLPPQCTILPSLLGPSGLTSAEMLVNLDWSSTRRQHGRGCDDNM